MLSETSLRQRGLRASTGSDNAAKDIIYPMRDDDLNDTFKRSGPHNLDRTGYDEESE